MSKFDIRPYFESQNWFSKVKMPDIRPKSNDKIEFRMSKCDIWPEFEGQNRILNVKKRYSALIRISR